ncbi:hypothetical protein [Paenibacillus sp. CCS19]|uniref:hypothetical protein n=1 Tax=Paenibacillus sp. CCS19 TaxID=3158387 RepID=UPI00295EC1CC|nr:hypothetical protein [Paenibacillus cellulosilyticus]
MHNGISAKTGKSRLQERLKGWKAERSESWKGGGLEKLEGSKPEGSKPARKPEQEDLKVQSLKVWRRGRLEGLIVRKPEGRRAESRDVPRVWSRKDVFQLSAVQSVGKGAE